MSDAPPWLSRLVDGSLDEIVEVQAGTLAIKSGQIVACDPLVFLESSDPFARKVPKGQHPVFIGRLEGEIAYARVELGEGDVEKWEVARVPGEEDVEGWPGYAIDAGVGAFCDLGAVEAFLKAEEKLADKIRKALAKEGLTDEDDPTYAARFDELRGEMGPDPVADLDADLRKRDHASVVIAPRTEGNVVAFKSGAGNGVFASFWGLGKRNKVLALVTDFGLLEEGASDELELPALEDEDDGLGDLASALSGGSASGMGGLEALAAALGMGGAAAEPEPESRQGPSPLFLQAKALLQRWVKEEKIELEAQVNLDDFAEAFLYKLSSLQGHRNPGAHIGEWLVDRREVADVFASDDELENDLRG